MTNREWAVGGRFSLADCAAAPALFYADWTYPISEGFPKVRAYRNRLNARSSKPAQSTRRGPTASSSRSARPIATDVRAADVLTSRQFEPRPPQPRASPVGIVRALVVDTALRRLYPVSCALQVGNTAEASRRALACALTQQRPRPQAPWGVWGSPPGGKDYCDMGFGLLASAMLGAW
jgi:Glutathione S-transferase, C-terminal domain